MFDGVSFFALQTWLKNGQRAVARRAAGLAPGRLGALRLRDFHVPWLSSEARAGPALARPARHLQSACDIIWYNGIILYHIMQYFWVLEEYIIKLKMSYDVIWYHIISHDTYYIIWYHVIWVYIFCHMMSPDVTWHHMMILNFTQWSLAGETNHVSFLQYV